MKEAFGTAYVVNFVIVFVILFIFFFVAGLSYTKAFKIKNRIVDIIEENECYDENANCQTQEQINTALRDAGYRVQSGNLNCEQFNGAELLTQGSNQYKYCVYRYNSGKRGTYYKVSAFMYFEIPIAGIDLEFPVYGETKVLGEY